MPFTVARALLSVRRSRWTRMILVTVEQRDRDRDGPTIPGWSDRYLWIVNEK
jgi:hypothetical protein